MMSSSVNRKLFCCLNKVLVKPIFRSLSHVPVLKDEVNYYLNPSNNKIILDMTFGAGGHTRNLLESAADLKVICLDRDPESYSYALELSKLYPNQVTPCIGRFSEVPDILNNLGIQFNSIDGVLFDYGCSSMQMDSNERGFSLSRDAKLDMRMDGERFPDNPTAADVLKYADEEDLAKIFKIYGEEKLAKKVARGIIEARYMFSPITTTFDLSSLVASICEIKYKKDKLQRPAHVATKVFQALRIFVNNELNEIDYGLTVAHKFLKIGGRLVTVSFHSLEDRIVKQHLTDPEIADDCSSLKQNSHILCSQEEMSKMANNKWMVLNKHVVTPTEEELKTNPRSRSAKLRAAVKIN